MARLLAAARAHHKDGAGEQQRGYGADGEIADRLTVGKADA